MRNAFVKILKRLNQLVITPSLGRKSGVLCTGWSLRGFTGWSHFYHSNRKDTNVGGAKSTFMKGIAHLLDDSDGVRLVFTTYWDRKHCFMYIGVESIANRRRNFAQVMLAENLNKPSKKTGY